MPHRLPLGELAVALLGLHRGPLGAFSGPLGLTFSASAVYTWGNGREPTYTDVYRRRSKGRTGGSGLNRTSKC
eukprot:7618129-Pyramimonas_sp.AAC.1